jgi:protein involved in polysaccharide export with SLBB domain
MSVTRLGILIAGLGCLTALSGAQAQSVRPGDRLVVRIFGAEQPLADTVLVNESSSVVLPKLGAVSLAGFPLQSVADSLRLRYAKYLRNPTVEMVILRRVTIVGEVKKPDIYYLDVNATLPDVVAHAGGITEFSNNRVSIKRAGQVTPVPDWETSHTSIANLESGDQVIVGRRPWIMQNILPAISSFAVLVSVIISLRR